MAELQFEAPLADFDGDEWNEFHESQLEADFDNGNQEFLEAPKSRLTPTERPGLMRDRPKSSSSGGSNMADNFNETFSGSLEDLVNTFDDKVTKCFKNYEEHVETFAPVQIRNEEDVVKECQSWWTLTGNYGNLLPINWSKTYTSDSKSSSQKSQSSDCFDLDEDDEDMDREDEELFFTKDEFYDLSRPESPNAEDVINEIEAMMEDGLPEMMLTESEMSSFSSETSSPERSTDRLGKSFEDSLSRLSLTALTELHNNLGCQVAEYRKHLLEELGQHTALKYERQLNNDMVCLMISIDNKQRDPQHNKLRSNYNPQRMYLTTVIPYRSSEGRPTVQQMQVYITILSAIDTDSPTVPQLLTDYILKVLCPTN